MDAASPLAPATWIRVNLRVTPLRIAVGTILLTLIVRLAGIGMRPLWLDEAYSAWFSALGWRELWVQVPTYEPHPPFYYSLLKIWREIAGGGAVALRTFSLLFSVATVPVIIAAGRDLDLQRPSGRPMLRMGVATFLFACSPMLVMIGQEARPYPVLIFAYALALFGVLRLTREFAAGGSGNWPSWLILVAGAELGLWAHGLGALYALCLGAALAPAWVRSCTRDRALRGLGSAALIAALYLPCLLMVMGRAGDWGTGWLSWEPVMALQLLGLYAVPVEVLTIGSAVAASIMILLIKRAIETGLKSGGWTAEHALLLLWWGPPLLAIAISALGMPIFLPRTLSATLVPAYLALAGAISRIEASRERLAFTAALVLTLTPTAFQMSLRPAMEPWGEVSAFLKRNVRPNDQVWLYPNDSALPLREAGATIPMHGVPGDYPAVGFKGPIRAGSPAVVSLTKQQAQYLAAQSSRTRSTIWLVTRQSAIFDPKNELPTELANVRQRGAMTEWGYINVTRYTHR
jgi:hypothetical protein